MPGQCESQRAATTCSKVLSLLLSSFEFREWGGGELLLIIFSGFCFWAGWESFVRAVLLYIFIDFVEAGLGGLGRV